jgi:muramoyltetrapeptide carboxypeptidase
MITPNYIRSGDKIAIVSPARKIKREEVQTAIEVFNSWGLEVVEGKNLYDDFNQFAGTDEARRAGLQEMMDDDSVKAIVCSRGGYGTVRIIDDLDFTRFTQNPKWIIGYSDITVLHSHIHRHFGIETMHAIMPVNFKGPCDKNQSVTSLKKALLGKDLEYAFDTDPESRPGTAEGQLVGGNLSILYSLSGTPSDIDTRGKILFIEDLDEYLYHIDRMMMNLKRSGKLEGLAGLIVGGMTDMHDNEVPYDKTANEIIMEAVADYDFPVCLNFPAGHLDQNCAMILGRKVKLTIHDQTKLQF